MINVNDVYLSANDKINSSENGDFSFERFNRMSWIAQLRLIDWLSGDVSGVTPPEMYQNQKDRDYLSPFIKKYPQQIANGVITKPDNYYLLDNAYLLGSYDDSADCETNEAIKIQGCNTRIELLSGDQFNERCHTFIEGMQPSFTKPITKIVGNEFEFLPKDLGSVTVEYIRYPVRAKIAAKIDPLYNNLVYDPATSIDFEWSAFAEDILAWFIADQFSNFTREQSLKQFNTATGKTVRP